VRNFETGERFGPWSGGDLIQSVPCKAGSCVIFSEALTHGALPWRGSHQRRTLRYSYAARGVQPHRPVEHPFRAELSQLGQAILEPAYMKGRPDLASLLAEEEEEEEEAEGAAERGQSARL
jgi:hypothetical protein